MNQAVITGAASGAAAPSAKAGSFEAARASAAQRSAITLSAVDEASGLAKDDKSVRREGNKLFTLRDSVWTDTGLKDSMQRVRVRAYSAAYFRILELLPELREPLALGDRVIVAGRSIAIEIEPTGVETLTDRELSDLQSKW